MAPVAVRVAAPAAAPPPTRRPGPGPAAASATPDGAVRDPPGQPRRGRPVARGIARVVAGLHGVARRAHVDVPGQRADAPGRTGRTPRARRRPRRARRSLRPRSGARSSDPEPVLDARGCRCRASSGPRTFRNVVPIAGRAISQRQDAAARIADRHEREQVTLVNPGRQDEERPRARPARPAASAAWAPATTADDHEGREQQRPPDDRGDRADHDGLGARALPASGWRLSESQAHVPLAATPLPLSAASAHGL